MVALLGAYNTLIYAQVTKPKDHGHESLSV